MLRAGHTVGLHCDEHVRHSRRRRDWVERDTDRALMRLGGLGVRPPLWGTPWGRRTVHAAGRRRARPAARPLEPRHP
ncbi:MAG: hypothetical protein JO325_22605 [Solirubrobacterales bacterium]|nr:hypothetical protein [Solirubrobacterales bacterium]